MDSIDLEDCAGELAAKESTNVKRRYIQDFFMMFAF
jgi:hypothetical protein